MVKLRLSRQGRKKLAIYKIVATDSRARRDGNYIESLGQYRPSNEPGQKTVLNEERVMYWLRVGAQPTDTVRSLLSKEGILLKWHLEKKKVEPARASEIFETWKSTRDGKLEAAKSAKEQSAAAARREAEAAKAAKLKAEEEAKAAAEATAAAEASAVESAPEAVEAAGDEAEANVAEA